MSCRKMVTKILAIINAIKAIPGILKELPGVISILKKVWNIIKGWFYKIFKKKQDLATTRLEICKSCESKMKMDVLGDVCAECGCVLDAKARVSDEKCELNKW